MAKKWTKDDINEWRKANKEYYREYQRAYRADETNRQRKRDWENARRKDRNEYNKLWMREKYKNKKKGGE